MIGRRRDIDNDFGTARERLLKHRTIRIPDVFTNAYSDGYSVHLKHRAAIARLKVPKFVEHAIIGQIYLVVDRHLLSVLDNRSGIEDVILPVDKANHGRNVTAPIHNFVEGCEVRVDKFRLQYKVFGRITGECKFGERHNICVDITRAIHPFQDLLRIAINVSDDDVNLCHRQTQLRPVFHRSAALKTNATAIVTKRRSFKLGMVARQMMRSAETQMGRGFYDYLQNCHDVVQSQPSHGEHGGNWMPRLAQNVIVVSEPVRTFPNGDFFYIELSRKHNRYDCLLKMARGGKPSRSVIVVRAEGKTDRKST